MPSHFHGLLAAKQGGEKKNKKKRRKKKKKKRGGGWEEKALWHSARYFFRVFFPFNCPEWLHIVIGSHLPDLSAFPLSPLRPPVALGEHWVQGEQCLGCSLLGCRTGKIPPGSRSCSPQQHCQPWGEPQDHSLTLGILGLVEITACSNLGWLRVFPWASVPYPRSFP